MYYAALSAEDFISAEAFDAGESKKALKGGSLQFPATKERQTAVIAEEKPVQLDNGLTMTKAVKFPGAGSSKYRSLKTTVEGPCTLTVYAMSSLPSHERRLVLYNSLNGQEAASAMAPAFSADGVLSPVRLPIPAAATPSPSRPTTPAAARRAGCTAAAIPSALRFIPILPSLSPRRFFPVPPTTVRRPSRIWTATP